jgi:hypothetical protein
MAPKSWALGRSSCGAADARVPRNNSRHALAGWPDGFWRTLSGLFVICQSPYCQRAPMTSLLLIKNKRPHEGAFLIMAERVGLIRSLRSLTPSGRASRVQTGRPVCRTLLSISWVRMLGCSDLLKFSWKNARCNGGEGGIRTHGTGEPYT